MSKRKVLLYHYFPILSSYLLHLIRFFLHHFSGYQIKAPVVVLTITKLHCFYWLLWCSFLHKSIHSIVLPIGEVSLFSFNTALKNPPLWPTQCHGIGTTDGVLPSSGLTGRFITPAIKRQFLGHLLLLLLSISWCIISHLIQTSLLTFQTRSFFLSNLTPLFAPSEKY